jgi:hypothetical protein
MMITGTIILVITFNTFCQPDTICAPLGCYGAYKGSFLPTFRYNPWVPFSSVNGLTPEEGTDKLSLNLGDKLPLYVA